MIDIFVCSVLLFSVISLIYSIAGCKTAVNKNRELDKLNAYYENRSEIFMRRYREKKNAG